MMNRLHFRWFALLPAAALAASLWTADSAVKPRGPNFHTADRCMVCHNGLSTRAGEDISIGLAWRPTMMANSARDPYWHAGVRRETLDHPEARAGIEDECSICHMPMARFESKAIGHEGTVFSHLGFLPDDEGDRLAADGVSCSLCHRIGKEKLGTRESFVGAFVIGGPNVQGERIEFGPYAPDAGHIRIMRSQPADLFLSSRCTFERAKCAPLATRSSRCLSERAPKKQANFPNRFRITNGSIAHTAHSGAASHATCR